MSVRGRIGPFTASTRGRVGVSAGGIGVSGRASGGRGLGFIEFLILAAIAIVVVMWPLCLWGHTIGLTPSWHELWHRDHAWMHEHYSLVGLRYATAAVLLGAAIAAMVVGVRRLLRL